jgi:hypothetical protein
VNRPVFGLQVLGSALTTFSLRLSPSQACPSVAFFGLVLEVGVSQVFVHLKLTSSLLIHTVPHTSTLIHSNNLKTRNNSNNDRRRNCIKRYINRFCHTSACLWLLGWLAFPSRITYHVHVHPAPHSTRSARRRRANPAFRLDFLTLFSSLLLSSSHFKHRVVPSTRRASSSESKAKPPTTSFVFFWTTHHEQRHSTPT